MLLYEYNSPAQFREVIDTIEAKRTRLVVFGISDERVTAFTAYLKGAYRRVRLPLGEHLLFERQTD